MKTILVSAVFFFVSLGCRQTFIDLSREEYGVVTWVKVEADRSETDGSMAVPKEDGTNTAVYTVRVYAYNHDGTPLFRSASWRISDPSVVELSPDEDDPPTHEARAYVRTLQDIFDLGGENEPAATVTACVTNSCEDYSGDVVCEPEVCSDPLAIEGVVNAEGFWELQGATFPFAVQLAASQTGRTLEAISSYYRPEINGRQIEFWADDWHYTGEFQNHEHVLGRVIRDSTGEDLGEWTADKCPDTGCAPP